jgi:formate-dependent phosphoribosylglycinamide formyltransferase (GAR transformylase)
VASTVRLSILGVYGIITTVTEGRGVLRGHVGGSVEAFVKFNSEITLLTVVQNNNPTLFCAIGHRQEHGDYQESWQPALISDKDLYEAQDMAEKSY